MRDPYEVLGVSRDAAESEIRAAFRKLATQHHPDRNPDDPTAQERFKEANAAYQILSDPERRAAYDRYGGAAFEPGGAAPGVGFVDLGGLDGIFGDIFGAFGVKTGDRGDLRARLRITFQEAATGATKDLSYTRADLCERCRGDGGEPGTAITTCGACHGSGRVRFQQALFPIPVERACSRCRGSGRIPATPCGACRGSGLVEHQRTIEVAIPAGVEDGSTRLVEHGGSRARPDRPAGDLEIAIEVAPHPIFQRSGDDILCRVPITFAQAALGGEVEVPTLDGKVKLRVPPSTQPGSVLKLRGKGVPHRLRGGRGDQLIEVSVEVPTELTARARELLEELAKELGEDVQPQRRTFVEKLKSLFE
ncbi:MAG: molecular chaperone DnaJ [Sorangiineae bacterium]|nr:molecular chaperone DnaJ [Polyangiaceae bacterium]MEB2321852.1 molecular chaperone DnaJ [Sorangiineae bacterium]